MFSFSKKIDKVFIDRIDGNTIKTLDDSGNPSDTIRPINDYINESNPIASLGKDLNDKGLTFVNFSDKDLEQIILFFLMKNIPKEIEDIVGGNGIWKLHKSNSFNWFPNSIKLFMGFSYTFLSINLSWRKNSFLECLFDNLPLYFSDPQKIKQIIYFVVKHFYNSLTSSHVIKIIRCLHNDSISYIVANFIHFDLFRKIKTKDFIGLLKEKHIEGVSSNYLRDLINGYMERDPSFLCDSSGFSYDDLIGLKKFIDGYNNEYPEDPIKGHEELLEFRFNHNRIYASSD